MTAPALPNTTKKPREDTQRETNRAKLVVGDGKKARNFRPLTLRGPTLRGSTLRGSTLRGRTFRGPKFRGPTLCGPSLRGTTFLGSGSHPSGARGPLRWDPPPPDPFHGPGCRPLHTTRTPNVHSSPANQKTQVHEKTPRETEEERIGGGRGKKKRYILGPPTSGPTLRGHLSGPHPVGLSKVDQIRMAKVGHICLTKVGLAKVGISHILINQWASSKCQTIVEHALPPHPISLRFRHNEGRLFLGRGEEHQTNLSIAEFINHFHDRCYSSTVDIAPTFAKFLQLVVMFFLLFISPQKTIDWSVCSHDVDRSFADKNVHRKCQLREQMYFVCRHITKFTLYIFIVGSDLCCDENN